MEPKESKKKLKGKGFEIMTEHEIKSLLPDSYPVLDIKPQKRKC